MKKAANNEIDLLLRSLAQRDSSDSATANDSKLEGVEDLDNHLDADELSSFAEGVLPAATRSLYTAHLADCSRCRRIVAQLALASGSGISTVSTEVSKASFWHYIAGFFTPVMMRYAVPAMSLVILVAVGLVWFQQERQADSVAQVTAPAAAQPSGPAVSTGDAASQETKQDLAKQPNRPRTEVGTLETTRTGEKAKNEAVEVDSRERAQPAEQKTNATDVVTAAPSVAREPDPNAASPKPAKEIADEREEVSKRQVAALPTVAEQSDDQKKSRRDQGSFSSNRKAETRSSSELRAGIGRGSTTGSADSATRTVSGRHFKRLNNAWADTAYESGAQTTTLSRGSEQYRALVGDEPGLRAIAEQLEGEVIVVWKGRAYRIR